MTSSQPTTSMHLLFARLFWMALGPMLLSVLTLSIIREGGGWFTPADFAFLAMLGGLPLARWLEFRGGDPRNSMGEPSLPGDLRRYVLRTLAIGLIAWLVANLIGNHWLIR